MSREQLFADEVRLTERLSVACCLTLQRCMSVISVSTRQKRRCTNVSESGESRLMSVFSTSSRPEEGGGIKR